MFNINICINLMVMYIVHIIWYNELWSHVWNDQLGRLLPRPARAECLNTRALARREPLFSCTRWSQDSQVVITWVRSEGWGAGREVKWTKIRCKFWKFLKPWIVEIHISSHISDILFFKPPFLMSRRGLKNGLLNYSEVCINSNS